MSKKIFVTISLVILTMINGCASITPSMLKPPNNPINNKIKSLIIGLESGNVVRSESRKSITVQTDFATIFSRTMDQNICESSREKWGYTDIRIVFMVRKISLFNLAYVSTFFLLPYVGAPLYINGTMEVEIGIYDSNKQIIKKYTLDKSNQYWASVYDMLPNAPGNSARVANIKLFHLILREFETLINNDAVYINNELEKTGLIVK
ncbi:MAG: hypothetical protein HOG73_08295 [Candidatus Marinimicrobia bacterium]|nr:hypothetical protein [Candidatus Neomarinimicrobiota bacterium]